MEIFSQLIKRCSEQLSTQHTYLQSVFAKLKILTRRGMLKIKRTTKKPRPLQIMKTIFLPMILIWAGFAGAEEIYLPTISADTVPENTKSFIVYNIPPGTSIVGRAQPPKMDDTGKYYQVVDGDALMTDNQLMFKTEDGFFGEVKLKIYAYAGTTTENLSRTLLDKLNTTILPDVNHLMFAQSGSIQQNAAKMEVGTVELNGTIEQDETVEITFQNSYENPVIVAYVSSRNDNDSVDVRVKNIDTNKATLFMQQPDGDFHGTETITYVVAEAGRFTLPDGTKVEAGRHQTDNFHLTGDSYDGDHIDFHQHFGDTPVLLHTLNSSNGKYFSSSTSYDVTKDGFYIEKEIGGVNPLSTVQRFLGGGYSDFLNVWSGAKSDTAESIGWIAIESNKTGNIKGKLYETRNQKISGRDGIDDAAHVIDFDSNFSRAPKLVVDGYTVNGKSGYWARSAGSLSDTSATVYAEEDGLNGERSHKSEGFGYFAIENTFKLDRIEKEVPIDLIVNPLLTNFELSLSGLPSGAVLLDKYGESIEVNEGVVSFYNHDDIKQLRLDISNETNNFFITATLNADYGGTLYQTAQPIYINTVNIQFANNGDSYIRFPLPRVQYEVSRIANAFVITEVIPDEGVIPEAIAGTFVIPEDDTTTRIEMIDADRLVFADGVVSASQYYKTVTMTDAEAQTLAEAFAENTDPSLIIFTGLPADSAINNSIPLGNGAFGIPADQFNIEDPTYSIDYSHHGIEGEFTTSIGVSSMTSVEAEYVAGQARISGYANAEAYAEAGFDSSFSVGDDGVRAEARAYVEAGAVATAGGAVSVDNVATVSVEVQAYYSVKHEISGNFEVDKDGISFGAYIGSEATAGVDTSVVVTTEFLPGTSFEAGGGAYVTSYAYVKADSEVAWGDDQYGLSASGGAEAGVAVKATVYSSSSLGGVTTGGSATVKAGLAAGASGGGVAMYDSDSGEINLGLNASVTVLIGFKLDLHTTVDISEVEDTGVLVSDGFMTGVEAVEWGFISAGEAIEQGYLSAKLAIEKGYMSVEDAVTDGYITIEDAIAEGLISVDISLALGLVTIDEVVRKELRVIENGYNYIKGLGEQFVDDPIGTLCSVFC